MGGDRHAPIAMSAFKLVLHPLLVWVLAGPVLGLHPLSVGVATLVAALPVGTNVFILASRYGLDQARISTAIVLSTALGLITLPIVILLLGPAR